VPGVELLAVAGDDQQRVVDADTEADHDPQERGEVGDRQHLAQQGDDRGSEADAEQCDTDGQAHGEDRAEGDDQDDDGERQPDGLGLRLLELPEDEPAHLDAETVDLGGVAEDRVADLAGPGELDVVGHLDVGVGDPARLGPLGRYLLRTLTAVGALDGRDVVELCRLLEQALHGGLDLGSFDALFGLEDDRPHHAGPLAAEVVVEDVEAGLGLDVGEVELVPERVTDRAGYGEPEDEHAHPKAQYELPTVMAPGAESGERALAS
jgi:hypothetical protein